MAYSYVVTVFLLTIFVLSARSIYLLAVRRQFFHLIIFLFVLRIIFVSESKTNFDQDQNKSSKTVVENWMINEVKISRNKLNDFQSAGVCENEQNLALCVSDILFNLHNSNEENSHFKAILQLTSSDDSLIDHLLKESMKKRKHLVLLEWLNRNNLLNRELPYLLNKNLIHSLKDLTELRLTSNQNQFKKETLKFVNKAKNVLLREKNLEAVENDIFEELIERKSDINDQNHNEFEQTVQLSFENNLQSSRTTEKNDVSFFQHAFHYVLTILLSILIWYIWDLGNQLDMKPTVMINT